MLCVVDYEPRCIMFFYDADVLLVLYSFVLSFISLNVARLCGRGWPSSVLSHLSKNCADCVVYPTSSQFASCVTLLIQDSSVLKSSLHFRVRKYHGGSD